MLIKRPEFLHPLANHDCYLHRHGAKHDISKFPDQKDNNNSPPSEIGKVSL